MQNASVKAIVWSQERCSACNQAKTLLKQHGIPYEERVLGSDEGNWTKEALYRAVPDARSVPQIFLNDKHIGGFPELRKYFSDNPQNA